MLDKNIVCLIVFHALLFSDYKDTQRILATSTEAYCQETLDISVFAVQS